MELSRSRYSTFRLSVATYWPRDAVSRHDTSTNDAHRLRSSAWAQAGVHGSCDLLLIRGFRVRVPGGVPTKALVSGPVRTLRPGAFHCAAALSAATAGLLLAGICAQLLIQAICRSTPRSCPGITAQAARRANSSG